MSLIVETGEGVSGANSYAGLSYARNYLAARNNATTWDATSLLGRRAALIEATSYIDMTFGYKFFGSKEFTSIEFFARNFLSMESLPVDNDTVTIDSVVFTFKDTTAAATDVQIGATIADTLVNFNSVINSQSGLEFSSALSEEGTVIILTALESGLDGNALTAVTSTTSVKIDTPTFTGGRGTGPQPLEFPRAQLYDRSGILVDGIPEKLKQATVEYASRAIAASLLPDPEYDASGRIITQTFEKVGPIETELTYLPASYSITRKYPFADKMLREYMSYGGGVFR